MTPADLKAVPAREADHRFTYVKDPSQFGELRLPSKPGPHPVVLLIHGGCWKAPYATLRDLAPMGDALKAAGIATWNIEYRRLPQPGSGWPGTYLDVGAAVDHLHSLAGPYNLDLNHVVVVGHSAGAHLAMWVGVRHKLPKGSELFVKNPLPIRGVVNLAGTIDMSKNIPGMEAVCRDAAVTSMLGGTPTEVPEHYNQVSAINMLPLGIPQVLVWGTREDNVPLALAEQYAKVAKQAGDRVELVIIPDAGHFESASPLSSAWPSVRSAILSLLHGK
jgi:acetyl esterase/lipase